MALQTSTYVSIGYVVHKGHTHMRIPNLPATEIWDSIKEFTRDERESLIAFLVGVNHPAAQKLIRLNEAAVRYQVA